MLCGVAIGSGVAVGAGVAVGMGVGHGAGVVVGASVAVAVILRISLEFILTLFRLAVAVEDLEQSVQGIAGRTHEIAHDLPRIQFWKPRRRSPPDEAKTPKS